MPQTRFAIAGQTFPEPSPYDRLILDRHLRFSGDAVAIIAAETEKAALKAMKLIRVNYQVLPAVLDFRTAKDNPVLVHPEEDWFPPCDVGGDPKRNLVASDSETYGDVDGILADCDIVLERTYHTKAFNQAMMEPFTTYADFDRYGRLHIISDCLSHPPHSLSRAGDSQKQNTSGKTQNRRRIRCQANCRLRSLSCLCCNENRSPGYDLLYP